MKRSSCQQTVNRTAKDRQGLPDWSRQPRPCAFPLFDAAHLAPHATSQTIGELRLTTVLRSFLEDDDQMSSNFGTSLGGDYLFFVTTTTTKKRGNQKQEQNSNVRYN